jgi:hypothetical protein
MAEQDAKTRVHNAIKDQVLKYAPTAEGSKKAITELTQSMLKIDQAVKKGIEPDLLATYRRDLEVKMRAVGMLVSETMSALENLKGIAEDQDDFEADSKEIETVQETLTKLRTSLSDWLVKAKKVDDRAKGEVQQGEKSEKEARREWALLIDTYDSINTATTSNLKMFRDECQKAVAAAKARDRDGLKDHRDMVMASSIMEEALQGKVVAHTVDAFLKKYDVASFSKEFRDEVADDRKTTVVELDKRLQALEQEVKKLQDAVVKLQITPPDYVKVTAKLGFKANFNARVEKALKLDEVRLAKELEAIAKDAGVKGTGKEFIAKLKKEKLYP